MLHNDYFASVWTSNDCNLKCRYCFFHKTDLFESGFKPVYMTKEIADALIKFCNGGIIQGISFFGAEPMLNWPIMKRILIRTHEMTLRKVAKKNFGSVYHVTTNGTQFTPENLEDLELHNVHINLSFDGLPGTQNYWRNNSYDKVLEHLDLLLKYPSLTILKLMVDPTKLYEDVKHIRDLGFHSVFINHLDPYGSLTYKDYSIDDWRKQYTRVIKELHDPGSFEVVDYNAWQKQLNSKEKNLVIGDGFTRKGLGVAPDGLLYPCHQAPSMGEKFSIGNVRDGIDDAKERTVRSVSNSPSCAKCVYRQCKCYVQMYFKHGRFGCDVPPWAQDWEIAMIELIQDLAGLPKNENYACRIDHSHSILCNVLSMVDDFKIPSYIECGEVKP